MKMHNLANHTEPGSHLQAVGHEHGPVVSRSDLAFIFAICFATGFGFLAIPKDHSAAATRPIAGKVAPAHSDTASVNSKTEYR